MLVNIKTQPMIAPYAVAGAGGKPDDPQQACGGVALSWRCATAYHPPLETHPRHPPFRGMA
jgi:hypothetical protein